MLIRAGNSGSCDVWCRARASGTSVSSVLGSLDWSRRWSARSSPGRESTRAALIKSKRVATCRPPVFVGGVGAERSGDGGRGGAAGSGAAGAGAGAGGVAASVAICPPVPDPAFEVLLLPRRSRRSSRRRYSTSRSTVDAPYCRYMMRTAVVVVGEGCNYPRLRVRVVDDRREDALARCGDSRLVTVGNADRDPVARARLLGGIGEVVVVEVGAVEELAGHRPEPCRSSSGSCRSERSCTNREDSRPW